MLYTLETNAGTRSFICKLTPDQSEPITEGILSKPHLLLCTVSTKQSAEDNS